MTTKAILTVGDLVDELSKHPREAALSVCVGWAKDTAIADRGEVVVQRDPMEAGSVTVRGWLSNCGTSLEIGEDEDEDEG